MYFEVFILALALSVDALTLTFVCSMVCKQETREKMLTMAGVFGAFQGLMPIIGFFFMRLIDLDLGKYTGFLLFLIFGYLGLRMLYDFLKNKNNRKIPVFLTYPWIVVQGLLTSVDALAAGISVSEKNGNIVISALIIALTTFLLCSFAVFAGKKVGRLFAKTGNLVGGIMLLILAFHAL